MPKTPALAKSQWLTRAKRDWRCLGDAPPQWRDDCDVVLAAVQHSPFGDALQSASLRLRSNKMFMLDVVRHAGDALSFASDELKSDRDIVLAAVANDGTAFRYAAGLLQQDKDFVLD